MPLPSEERVSTSSLNGCCSHSFERVALTRCGLRTYASANCTTRLNPELLFQSSTKGSVTDQDRLLLWQPKTNAAFIIIHLLWRSFSITHFEKRASKGSQMKSVHTSQTANCIR